MLLHFLTSLIQFTLLLKFFYREKAGGGHGGMGRTTGSGSLLKGPQIMWLKTTEISSLPVLESRSLESRGQQGCVPSEGSRKESFFASS